MIGDFIKAVRQLLDPRFRKVFLLSTLLTIGLLAAFYFAALWLLGFIPDLGFSLFGYEITFFDDAVGWLAQGAVIWLLAVLMFPVAALFIGLFLEEIADVYGLALHQANISNDHSVTIDLGDGAMTRHVHEG